MHSCGVGRPCIVEELKIPKQVHLHHQQQQQQQQQVAPIRAVASAAVMEGFLLSTTSSTGSLVSGNAALVLAKAALDAARDAAALSLKADELTDLLCYYTLQEEISRLERTIQNQEQREVAEQLEEARLSRSVDDHEDNLPIPETSGRSSEVEVVVKSRRRSERLQRKRESNMRANSSTHEEDVLDRLIEEVGKKRLTMSEEARLARGVQELTTIENSRAAFMKKTKREPSLQEWAAASDMEARSFQKRLWRGRLCKNKMIACNIGLVTTIAKTYQDFGLPLEDLIQEGCLGLIRGIEKFDPSRGYKLSTYTYWWIKQAIGRAVTLKAHAVRLPMHSNEVLSKIKRVRRALQEKHGRQADDSEVADAVGISVPKMYALLNSRKVRSFDKPVGRNGDTNLQEVIPDDGFDSAENVMNRILLKEDVDMTLKHLKPQEREVMRFRYGLHGGRPKTLEEIGYIFNVTRERIRQIEVRAMHKLKTSEFSKLLRLHLPSASY